MKRSHLAFAAPFVLLVGTAPRAQDALWVVDDDGGPGVDFTELQAAIDAAAAGDVILVRAGEYLPFALVGKGLTLAGEAGASVVVAPAGPPVTTSISGIPAGEAAVVRGIRFRPPEVTDGDLVRLAGSDGVVWLEDVTLETVTSNPFEYEPNQRQALRVEDCAAAVLSGCTIAGLAGAPLLGQEFPSIGLALEASTVHLFATRVTTGPTLVPGDTGSPGLEVVASFVSLRDCQVVGGPGGIGGGFGPPPPGNGGPGIEMDGASEVWPIECFVAGGVGGTDIFGSSGSPGAPIANAGGVVSEHARPPIALVAPTFVRAGAPAVLRLATEPDAHVFLLASSTAEPVFFPGFPAALGGGALPHIVPLGRTQPSGGLAFCVGIPPLPPSVDTHGYLLQAMARVPGAGFQFSNVSAVTVLSEAGWGLVARSADPPPVLPAGLALEARGERVRCVDEVLPLD